MSTNIDTIAGSVVCSIAQLSSALNVNSGSVPAVSGTTITLFTTGNGLGIANTTGSVELSTAGLSAPRVYTVPDITDVTVDVSSVQTLTNKTISGGSINTVNGATITGTPAVGQSPVAVSTTATWKYTGVLCHVFMGLSASSTSFTSIGGYIIYKNPSVSITALRAVYANVTCAAGITGTVRLFDTNTSLVVASVSVTSAATLYTLTLTTANIPTGVTSTLFRWQSQRNAGPVGNITTQSVTLVY